MRNIIYVGIGVAFLTGFFSVTLQADTPVSSDAKVNQIIQDLHASRKSSNRRCDVSTLEFHDDSAAREGRQGRPLAAAASAKLAAQVAATCAITDRSDGGAEHWIFVAGDFMAVSAIYSARFHATREAHVMAHNAKVLLRHTDREEGPEMIDQLKAAGY
ncbi:hypothetical protein [Thioalkalivibrio sp. ALE14]|uniref:hypothetical protein n=1 Tax=Thioalkalivibrio sp. ALE14 TaxID=1158168 RepID=UPI0012DD1A39|nr:hypothetical protein [Thioalkalivibrio sp. ALE14]